MRICNSFLISQASFMKNGALGLAFALYTKAEN